MCKSKISGEEKNVTYIAPAVSRWYRFDWQYAFDVSKLTSLSTVSAVFLIMPLIKQANVDIPINLWFLWYSGLSYIISLGIITIWGPSFIKEYRDFGQYIARNHSHRWIVWEFYNNVKKLEAWETIVEETEKKGLSKDISEFSDPDLIAKFKCFQQEITPTDTKVEIGEPVNDNRDIYMPIVLKGRKVILSMEEGDKQLAAKEKELFWILYSQSAKEKSGLRYTYWGFITISIILTIFSIVHNIGKIVVPWAMSVISYLVNIYNHGCI